MKWSPFRKISIFINYLFFFPGKSERDVEREQSLVEQWVSLTEERNAVMVPASGSGIPGAPADWHPPSGMEPHIPVLFLDLNGSQFVVVCSAWFFVFLNYYFKSFFIYLFNCYLQPTTFRQVNGVVAKTRQRLYQWLAIILYYQKNWAIFSTICQ